jgi:hypothetical protein
MTQTQRLYELLRDGLPHHRGEIVRFVYPSSNICDHCGRGDDRRSARLSARVKDLVEGKWPGKSECTIGGYWENKMYWYRMETTTPPKNPESMNSVARINKIPPFREIPPQQNVATNQMLF